MLYPKQNIRSGPWSLHRVRLGRQRQWQQTNGNKLGFPLGRQYHLGATSLDALRRLWMASTVTKQEQKCRLWRDKDAPRPEKYRVLKQPFHQPKIDITNFPFLLRN